MVVPSARPKRRLDGDPNSQGIVTKGSVDSRLLSRLCHENRVVSAPGQHGIPNLTRRGVCAGTVVYTDVGSSNVHCVVGDLRRERGKR